MWSLRAKAERLDETTVAASDRGRRAAAAAEYRAAAGARDSSTEYIHVASAAMVLASAEG